MATVRYYEGIGRRKTSTARVRLYPGTGSIVVNERSLEDYFPRETDRIKLLRPLNVTEAQDQYNVSVHVAGGGTSGQTGAVIMGVGALIAVTGGAMFVLVIVGTVFLGRRTATPELGYVAPDAFTFVPAVAGGAEVGDAQLDDRLLVERHRRDAIGAAVHEHERCSPDDLQPLLRRGDRAARHEAVDAAGERACFRQFVSLALVGVGEQHGEPVAPAALLHRADHVREERVGDVGDEHADGTDSPAGHLSGSPVRGVAELVDRGVHSGSGRLADQLRAAEHPRHRAGVHAGFDGDISERDRLTRHRRAPTRLGMDDGRDGGVSLQFAPASCKRLHRPGRSGMNQPQKAAVPPAIRPGRAITGMSAILLPFLADGSIDWAAVSYTHLTLPTIYSV